MQKEKIGEQNGDVDKRTPDVSALVIVTVLNTTFDEIEKKIPNITDLVNKADYNTKILETEAKYFVTSIIINLQEN